MIPLRGRFWVPLVCLFTVQAVERPQRTDELLRLDRLSDQAAFRQWFSFLTEVQAYAASAPDVTDCAALLRYAFREALRVHDSAWATSARLPLIPGFPDVRKYNYPRGPAGAALFRTGDLRWAEFADAETLQRQNAFFVSRNLERARAGDLLFYRQLSARMPFHAMVFVGRSHIAPGSESWIVYHTGPSADSKGEIRRVTTSELKQHPSPRWRPLEDNANFLGVYRWNILRTQP